MAVKYAREGLQFSLANPLLLKRSTGGTASVNLQYPAQLTGHYQLEITGANKKKTLLKVVIQ